MAGPYPPEIATAFAGNNELRKRVHEAIDHNPTQRTLFRDISTYILKQASQASNEPVAKKRKLDDGNGVQNAASGGAESLLSAETKAWKQYPATSFSLPQRKKFVLEIVSGKEGGIRAIGADGKVEIGIAWKHIEQVFCLPVPEKAKRQHNFIVIPTHGDGVLPVPESLKASPTEPILWTFEEATGKNIIAGVDPGPDPMAGAIEQAMKQAGLRKTVVFPDATEFSSAIVQFHRKGEKSYHTKAHRGSKEGYLFFTSAGIMFGFKKPLAYFDFSSIDSMSFTNVVRNTFNLVIGTPGGDVEFGMIDQEDYAGIVLYIQKYKLQDASMAAARRAKKLNINPPAEKEEGTNGNEAGQDDEESELQKAEKQLLDEEEEDDDDFDPGSEGESEGSGSSDSEEDSEGGEYGEEGGDEEEDEEEGEEGDEEGDEDDEGVDEDDVPEAPAQVKKKAEVPTRVKKEVLSKPVEYDEPEYDETGAEEMEYDEPH